MNQAATAQVSDAASDSRVSNKVRTFRQKLNMVSTPFWELPQPNPHDGFAGLQNKQLRQVCGVGTFERTITQYGRM